MLRLGVRSLLFSFPPAMPPYPNRSLSPLKD